MGNIITDQQNGAGLQLTGDLVLKLTESVYFADIATRYNLTLKHQVSDLFVVSADSANLSQLLLKSPKSVTESLIMCKESSPMRTASLFKTTAYNNDKLG